MANRDPNRYASDSFIVQDSPRFRAAFSFDSNKSFPAVVHSVGDFAIPAKELPRRVSGRTVADVQRSHPQNVFAVDGIARKTSRTQRKRPAMRYLHTMVRVTDIAASLEFYCDALGMKEIRRLENEKGRFTLVFLAAPGDEARALEEKAPMLELTYNWDVEDYGSARNFGHLAFAVDDIYATCAKLQAAGVTINRPPRDGHMAFVRSPDLVSIELLQKGDALPKREPWASMPNTGTW
jgi:lactoylglutathione lyase